MQSGLSLFKSKVAKRIFFLFLLSAMLPITIFSFLSFTQVSAQLREQSIARIQNMAKSYGLVLFERFTALDFELEMIKSVSHFSTDSGGQLEIKSPSIKERKGRFVSVYFISDSGKLFPMTGEIKTPPKTILNLTTDDITSTTKIMFKPENENVSRVFLIKKTLDTTGEPGLIVGEADTVQLWGVGYDNILPPLTDASILGQNRNILFGFFKLPATISHRIRFDNDNPESRSLEYRADGEDFFIGYWPLFLRSKFEGPNLIVILRNKQQDVFAPLSYFKRLFPLVTLLSFWVVLLLSIVTIRKSMIPLEKLKKGAMRLARRNFDTRVNIKSGDEFEALADTFNQSAAYLGRQFYAMEAMAEIDQVVHATLNTNTIINTVLKHMLVFFSCDSICIGLINHKKPDTIRTMTCSEPGDNKPIEEFLTIAPEEQNRLSKETGEFFIEIKDQSPSFLPLQATINSKHFMIQPLYHNKTFSGIVCLGHKEKHLFSNDDFTYIQRLVNQLSSALSNAHLVEELESLNWGTLEALARTVDTKSKWTAGHSERVAKLAVRIAKVLGFNAKEIDNLHRAAFLHDIGKIGVPLVIIDKLGELSDEEYKQVMEHPVIGAKIIEPIEAYADAIPIILQHHERFDGKGYPYGIAGEDIVIGARVLAVADVYDAIISNRPYRQGSVKENVIKIIVAESGKHFDPKVVDAFLTSELAD